MAEEDIGKIASLPETLDDVVTQVKAIDLPVESVQIRMLLLIEDEVVRQWAGELSAYNSVVRAGDNKTELEAREVAWHGNYHMQNASSDSSIPLMRQNINTGGLRQTC